MGIRKLGTGLKNPRFDGTGGMHIPTGTTAQRPTGPRAKNGEMRFNSTINSLEMYSEELSQWSTVATFSTDIDAQVLVVGGGGGSNFDNGGGGGAGPSVRCPAAWDPRASGATPLAPGSAVRGPRHVPPQLVADRYYPQPNKYE